MWQRYEFFSKKAYLCSMNNEKKYLLGLTLAELKQVAKDLGMLPSPADRWRSGSMSST